MKQVVWMVAGSVGSWALVALVAGHGTELFWGMLGPLVAASATWMAVVRAHRRNPAGVTALLLTAFAVKMLFFGAYVVLVMRLGQPDLTPFAAAFVVYFVALYVVQAVLVRGLAVSGNDVTPR